MKNIKTLKVIFIAVLIIPFISLSSYAQDPESEQGNLIFIITDNVSPSNFVEYEQWIKEFKELADATGAPGYGVGKNEEAQLRIGTLRCRWRGVFSRIKSGREYQHDLRQLYPRYPTNTGQADIGDCISAFRRRPRPA